MNTVCLIVGAIVIGLTAIVVLAAVVIGVRSAINEHRKGQERGRLDRVAYLQYVAGRPDRIHLVSDRDGAA